MTMGVKYRGRVRYRLHNIGGHRDYWWAWVTSDPHRDLLDYQCLDCGARFRWKA